MNENITKNIKKNSFFEKHNNNALTPLIMIYSFLQWLFFSKLLQYLFFFVTPSDNYFTISPHNLALLHSTLSTLLPSTFKEELHNRFNLIQKKE